MWYCYSLFIVLLLVQRSTCAPVLAGVSQPSNYSVNLLFDNQCASKDEVKEITKDQDQNLTNSLLNAQGQFYQRLASCLSEPAPQSTDNKCSATHSMLENIAQSINNLTEEVRSLKRDSANTISTPALSCQTLYTLANPSGYYWLQTNTSNEPVSVYCDMERSCCGHRGGWTRVANINMTDQQQQCPLGFRLISRSTQPYRTCGRPENFVGCTSTTFAVNGLRYSHVCGRVIGYQVGQADAFYSTHYRHDIEGLYLDGISLTHGRSPREHIWSFATALRESFYLHTASICPCSGNSGSFGGRIPSFVGNDYFCDSAVRGSSPWIQSHFYQNDPLWDGQGCGSTSSCCEFNNPPWFCKQLPQPTNDDIELRICHGNFPNQDSPFEIVELYVR